MRIIKHGFISPKVKNKFRYNAWPTVITLSDGTLIAGWSGERLMHICPFGKVMLSRSYDGGKTFSKAEPTGRDGLPPHMFVTSKGAVIMSYGCRHEGGLLRSTI